MAITGSMNPNTSYLSYIDSVFSEPGMGSGHKPGHCIEKLIDAGRPPALFGLQADTYYANGQAYSEIAKPLLPRTGHALATAIFYNALASQSYLYPWILGIEAFAQGRKAPDLKSKVHNIVQATTPTALGVYVGMPLGHYLASKALSKESAQLATALKDKDLQVLLRKIAEHHVEEANQALRSRQHELMPALARRFPETATARDYGHALRKAEKRGGPHRRAAVERFFRNNSYEQLRVIDQATEVKNQLSHSIKALLTEYQAYSLDKVHHYQKGSNRLKQLLTQQSRHFSQDNLLAYQALLDEGLGLLKQGNRPTPMFVDKISSFYNKKQHETVAAKLQQLNIELAANKQLSPGLRQNINQHLHNLQQLLRTTDSKRWYSPHKLIERSRHLSRHKAVLNDVVQRFSRENAERGMDKAIASLMGVKSAAEISHLHGRFGRFYNLLDESQRFFCKLLKEGGGTAGFLVAASMVAPLLAHALNQGIHYWAGHWRNLLHPPGRLPAQDYAAHTSQAFGTAPFDPAPLPKPQTNPYLGAPYVNPAGYVSWVTDSSLGAPDYKFNPSPSFV